MHAEGGHEQNGMLQQLAASECLTACDERDKESLPL